MNKTKAILYIILFAIWTFTIGVLIGDKLGRERGYWDGVCDKQNEYLQSADSLCEMYRGKLDFVMNHADSVIVTTRTYKLK